jgi:hypothetical protein
MQPARFVVIEAPLFHVITAPYVLDVPNGVKRHATHAMLALVNVPHCWPPGPHAAHAASTCDGAQTESVFGGTHFGVNGVMSGRHMFASSPASEPASEEHLHEVNVPFEHVRVPLHPFAPAHASVCPVVHVAPSGVDASGAEVVVPHATMNAAPIDHAMRMVRGYTRQEVGARASLSSATGRTKPTSTRDGSRWFNSNSPDFDGG